MGASSREARSLCEAAVYEKLDPEILDVIRFGMKSRCGEHFSMKSSAALVVAERCEDFAERWDFIFGIVILFGVFSTFFS